MTEEQTFPLLLEFPPEIRMMMIDKMETEQRCRFAGTSKLCQKEAKSSKNYIYGLRFYSKNDNICITVKLENSTNKQLFLKFLKEPDMKLMTCENWRGEEISGTILDDSKECTQHAFEHLILLLQTHQRAIKYLEIEVYNNYTRSQLDSIAFEIQKLNNLQKLIVNMDVDIRRLLPKTVTNLEHLVVSQEIDEIVLEDCEQIYQVQKVLNLSNTLLTNDQFLRLSASTVTIHIGHLTEQNIFSFIKSWQNGTIGKEVKYYRWYLGDSDFNVLTIFQFFAPEHDIFTELEINHEKEAGKKAILRFWPMWLGFDTYSEDLEY